MQGRDEVYSKRIRAGKRTYFFDVRSTRSNDYYITITESKKRFSGRGYDKHKIFLYKEDFNKFFESLEETINYVKKELLPEYDYEEFDRRQDDYDEEGGNHHRGGFEGENDFAGEENREKVPAPAANFEDDEESLPTTWED